MRIFLATCLSLLMFSASAQTNIKDLLPSPFELPGMQLSGEAEIFEGEDLFDMINGGAEVYLEYGFERVVSHNYIGISGKTNLRLEIYKMSDPSAAFGIFSYSGMGNFIVDKISYYLIPGDGFGMMQKGSYFIVASYANIKKEVQKGLLQQIVKSLDNSITELPRKPSLYEATKPPCQDFTKRLYFRGKYALQNITYLDFDIPFQYSDGVAYACFVFDYMIFSVTDSRGMKTAVEQTISNILKKNPEFSTIKETFGFSIQENGIMRFEVIPDGDRLTLIKHY